MKRLETYNHRVYKTPDGPRLMGYVRAQLLPNGPEEFVRQDVLRSLVEEYGYPRESLLSEEPVARGTKNRRRADVLVELPTRVHKQHSVKIGEDTPATPEQPDSRAYSDMVAHLEGKLQGRGGIKVVDIPDELSLRLDGLSVRGRVLGFKSEGAALAMWLKLLDEAPGLPNEVGFYILGYGLTATEKKLARKLGLPAVEYTDEERDDFFDHYSTLFGLDQDLEIDAGGCISKSEDEGWLVLYPDKTTWGGVLVHLDYRSPPWGAFFKARASHMALIPVGDDNIAYRDSLDTLKPGDPVFVMLGDDARTVEGTVTSPGTEVVKVDCGSNGNLTAYRAMSGKGAPWLAGRAAPLDGLDGYERHRQRVRDFERTFVVIECKAPSVAFSEEVREQGLDYATTRRARYLVLTNGQWARTYVLSDRGYTPIKDIPTYQEAISAETFAVGSLDTARQDYPLPSDVVERPDALRLMVRHRANVGAQTKQSLWLPILLLDEALRLDAPMFTEPVTGYGVTLSEDLGLRWHEPGNPSGGTYPGDYRDFLLMLPDGTEAVFGVRLNRYRLAVKPNGKTVGGGTILTGCLSFGATYHPALQCRLDQFLRVEADRLKLWHSGIATVGKGRVKNADVIRFVQERQPGLVKDGKVDLGGLPLRPGLRWDEMSNLVLRLAGYVMLRHDFKEEVRAARKSR